MEGAAASHAKRIAVAAAAAAAAVNIWTGAPLLSLWIGSRFVGETRLSMGAVGIVVLALSASVFGLVALLGWLSATYDRLSGRVDGVRRPAPWLRSMRAERHDLVAAGRGLNAVEQVVVLSVGVCALLFNVWFFFFAGSPLAPA